MKQYETVIGLEVHVELATKTKIFCGCSTEFGGEPNTHICPVCTGMPGSLPVLNKKVVEYVVAVGLAVNCEITRCSKFDRKNYFYPDNPQNYQISQRYLPICKNGKIEIKTSDGEKRIGIHEIHMEEDAGKLLHDEKEEYSLIDYNRSGVPLIEVVSEPDLSSSEEVLAYLEKLRSILRYLGASDGKLQEGSMRVDVNLSVCERGSKRLGTRTEMKNLNSFKAITRAIKTERERQITCLEKGNRVIQETRRWDDNKGESYVMRSKEDAQDYRYFPEPDLPPLWIEEAWLQQIKAELPELQEEKQKRYQKEYDLPEYDISILTGSRKLAEIFEETTAICGNEKKVSNWLMGEGLRLLKEKEMEEEEMKVSPKNLAKLIQMVENKFISAEIGKEIFERIFMEDIEPEAYVQEKNLKIVNNPGELEEVIAQILTANPQSLLDYQGGKTKAMGFIVGQTMKAMKGKADPKIVNEMVKKACEMH
ncbi:MAG: Asp-tRNA(Asn)/Glu-tRNA(Gln) amidotransferase subunit GatB [Acetivibrio sp.]